MIVACTQDIAFELYNILSTKGEPVALWNFCGSIESVPSLRLFPDIDRMAQYGVSSIVDPINFDIMYYDQILMNENNMFEFFHKISNYIYMGTTIILIINPGDLYETLTESLFKFIESRYGYNGCVLINTIDDYFMCREDRYTVAGREVLDKDIQKYTEMCVKRGIVSISEGGNIYVRNYQ